MSKLIRIEKTGYNLHPYHYFYECDICHKEARWYYTKRSTPVICVACRSERDKAKLQAKKLEAEERQKLHDKEIYNKALNDIFDKVEDIQKYDYHCSRDLCPHEIHCDVCALNCVREMIKEQLEVGVKNE